MSNKIKINNLLNPCPYCGGGAEMKQKSMKFCNDIVNVCYVECPNCGASTNGYDTVFGYYVSGKFRRLTIEEIIEKLVNDWNGHIFNDQTKLSHMSDTEKAIWQIEELLSIAWYGLMVPMDSLEWKTGWQLRKIAENLKLLRLHSVFKYDLGEIARILFDDSQGKETIFHYFREKEM